MSTQGHETSHMPAPTPALGTGVAGATRNSTRSPCVPLHRGQVSPALLCGWKGPASPITARRRETTRHAHAGLGAHAPVKTRHGRCEGSLNINPCSMHASDQRGSITCSPRWEGTARRSSPHADARHHPWSYRPWSPRVAKQSQAVQGQMVSLTRPRCVPVYRQTSPGMVHLWLACRSWCLWESALFVHLVNTRIRVFRLYADVYMHRPRRYKQRQLRTLVQKQRDGVLDTLEQCLLSVVELLLYAYLLLSC
jgi:hypothetical protein